MDTPLRKVTSVRPDERLDASPAPRGAGTRFLGLFAEVREGEALTAVLLMSTMFLTLAAYYLLKTIREPLILAGDEGGAEVKSYSAAAIAGLLIILVPTYSAVASRVSRIRLVNSVTLFFILTLIGFFLIARAGTSVGVPFFIWVGIFSLMFIAQLWALANDLYTVGQGKRLFAIVGFGASLGSIAGAFVAGKWVGAYGPYPVMLGAASLLCLCLVLTNVVHAREARRATSALGTNRSVEVDSEAGTGADSGRPIAGRTGFALVLADRYLLLVAGLMVILNLVNTTGEYILGETISTIAKERAVGGAGGADEEKIIGAFYGNFFTWVNAVSALIQAFLVSRVIKYLGVRGALLVLPAVALVGYTALAVLPLLNLIKTAKIAENSVDYSLQNTTRNALYLPTSRAAKYTAKQANDTFFVRFGDVLSAGLVFAGLHWLGFAPKHFAAANAGLVVIWFVLAIVIGRRFERMATKGAGAAEPAVAV